jgi:hypothetical protein
MPWQVHIHILQIVLPRPSHPDEIRIHNPPHHTPKPHPRKSESALGTDADITSHAAQGSADFSPQHPARRKRLLTL